MIDKLSLTARRVDPTHFVFCPETWEKELKPVNKAKWTHDTAPQYKQYNYTLKEGAFLAFPEYNNGGFYAAKLYAIVRELDCLQVHATFTNEGLILETIGGELKTRLTLKPCGMQRNDTPYRVNFEY